MNKYVPMKNKFSFILKLTMLLIIPSLTMNQSIEMKINQISKNSKISTQIPKIIYSNFKKLKFLEESLFNSTNATADNTTEENTKSDNSTEDNTTASTNQKIQEENAQDYNYTSCIWTVQVEIGNPAQEFTLELDTTISPTWVPSVDCINCQSKNKYNASESDTAEVSNRTIKIEDYLGDIKGDIVKDDFKLKKLGYEIKDFSFLQAIELNKKFNDLPEGKLGLSYVNKYGDKFSFLNTLYDLGKIKHKMFTLDFDKKNKHNGGKIIFGDVPSVIKKASEENYGYCNLTSSEDLEDEFKDGWTCELTHIFFNNATQLVNLTDAIEMDNTRVVFDSSYEFIGVSSNQYELFYEKYIKENFEDDCKKNIKNKETYIICDLNKQQIETAASLFIILQGYVIEIEAEDLFIKLDEEDQYLFAIKFFNQKDDETKVWVLGQIFLKNLVTVFDAEKEQVGFYGENNVYNKYNDWIQWYTSDYYYLLVSRHFYLLIGASVVFALFMLFICFIVMRSIKRRSRHGPLIENEVSH